MTIEDKVLAYCEAIHTQGRDQLVTHGKSFADSVYREYIADERYLRAAWDEMGTDYFNDKLCIPEKTLKEFRQTVLE